MALNKNEKNYLKFLVEGELEQFKKERKHIRDITIKFLEAEEKYEEFAEKLIKKLK